MYKSYLYDSTDIVIRIINHKIKRLGSFIGIPKLKCNDFCFSKHWIDYSLLLKMFLHYTLDQGSLLQFLESLNLIQIGVPERWVKVIGCDSHVAGVFWFITDLLDFESSDSLLYSVIWVILLKLLTFLSVELVVGHHLVDQ